jgi:hypothetical protein
MVIQDVCSSLVKSLEPAGFMIDFKHRLYTTEEINSLKKYCLTQGNIYVIRHRFWITLQTSFVNKSLVMNKRIV